MYHQVITFRQRVVDSEILTEEVKSFASGSEREPSILRKTSGSVNPDRYPSAGMMFVCERFYVLEIADCPAEQLTSLVCNAVKMSGVASLTYVLMIGVFEKRTTFRPVLGLSS